MVRAGAERGELGAIDQMSQVLKGEDLAARREQQLLHVLPTHLESAPGDAGDHLKSRRVGQREALPA